MRRVFFGLAILLGVAMLAAQPAAAQNRFAPGSMDLGMTLGMGNLDNANTSFGIRAERALKALPSMGDGILGLQVGIDYYAWTFGLEYLWEFIPIGAALTYHFNVGPRRFAPFLAAGAGYNIANCGGPKDIWGVCEGFDSEVYPIARVGARFYVSDVSAIFVDGGLGVGVASLGMMFKVK